MNVPVKVLDGLILISMSMVLLIVDDVPAVNVVSVAVSVAVMILVLVLVAFPVSPLAFDNVGANPKLPDRYSSNTADAPLNVMVSPILYELVLLMVTVSAGSYPDTVVEDDDIFNGMTPTGELFTVKVCVPNEIVPSDPLELNWRRGRESNKVGLFIVEFLALLVAVSPLLRNLCGLQSNIISNCPALLYWTGDTSRPLV